MVSALSISVVAVFGAYIAWNLWKTNHNILRERLYDRRYEIFEATQTLIAGIVQEKGLTWESARLFGDVSQRARFMFSAEDSQYFELLRTKALELAQVTSLTDVKLRSQAAVDREQQQELCDWFDEQVEEVFSRMNKYLLFEK